jgi:signal transduction histidine kinase
MKKHRLYNTLIAPRSNDPNIRNQEAVLNWLLVGSLILALVAFVIALFGLLLLGNADLWPRLVIIAGLFLLFAGLLRTSRHRQQQVLPAMVLLAIFFVSAFWLIYQWGILVPDGTLLFSLVIVMAGILLSARSSLYAALLISLVIAVVEYATIHHRLRPNLLWERQSSNFIDVAGFAAIYAILALVSWLFNGRMEMALTRAKRSEKALKHQRDQLEITVEQRTRALHAAQLEQIQEVYRFAELGHLSTALFHDLANHLMSVSIDIEGLQKGNQSAMLARIQENITYINEVVKRVRQQLNGQNEAEHFDIMAELDEIKKMLAYQSSKAQVVISLQSLAKSPQLTYRGNLTRFRQIIINLMSNAIEAYDPPTETAGSLRTIEVAVAVLSQAITITITDHGKIIQPAAQAKIFMPFYSTKDKGMGIGLFIVKKVTEEDFGGSINVTSNKRVGTTFTVTLPVEHHGSRAKKITT